MNSPKPSGADEAVHSGGMESAEAEPQAVKLDPSQVQLLQQRLEAEQSLPLGVLGGVVASLAGAAVWAGVTVATGYQIGFMAIGVGFLVGYAVRTLGKGVTTAFGVAGAALSLFGCALGNLLAVAAMAASQLGIPFQDVLSQLDASNIPRLMAASFSLMDVLFYGIAVYYGFKLSFRRLTPAEVDRMLSGSGSTA